METIVKIKDMSYTYFGTEKNGIKNINLEINKGELILITGRSGCGKTTLTRALNGMVPHYYEGEYEGEVSVFGKKIKDLKVHDIAIHVGTVMQDPRSQFFATTTTSELAFGMENIGIDRKKMHLRIEKISNELELDQIVDRSIFELSSGEKQKIAIGSVCAMEPSILIFDEPSANIDGYTIKELADKIGKLKKAGHTIIIVEHRLHYLKEHVDRIIYMDKGVITEILTCEEFSLLSRKQLSQRGLRVFNIEELIDTMHVDNKVNKTLKNNISKQNLLVEIKDLTYKTKQGKTIIDNINMKFYAGETVAIIGKNGAGKTTTINTICGLLKESNGEIRLNGKKTKASKRVKSIYMALQDCDYQLFSESVEEEIKIGNEKDKNLMHGGKKILEELNIEHISNRHPASLSGGEKQRVVIASAIARNADILIFDEPTSGLDFDNMERIAKSMNKLESKQKSVIIVSHDIEFIIRTCKKVIVLEDGKISDAYSLDKEGLCKLYDFCYPW